MRRQCVPGSLSPPPGPESEPGFEASGNFEFGADNRIMHGYYYVREAQEECQKKKTRGGRVNTGWAKEDRQKKRIEDMYWDGGLLGL